MLLHKVHIKGFRNFKDCEINLNEKSLVIGPNDIGKSNFLYALRLLLDKGLSELALELDDSDFYVFEDTATASITLYFKDVDEEVLLSKLRGNVAEGKFVIRYEGYRDVPETPYRIFIGADEEKFEEIETRNYLRFLNLKFINSYRDLQTYISRERKKLLQRAKEGRNATEIKSDDASIDKIQKSLIQVNDAISSLSYISSATKDLNKELSSLSEHHSTNEVVFDPKTADTKKFVENLSLAAKVDGKVVNLGGDGRNNQVFLALWANSLTQESVDSVQVSIFCIEEPEAHLHPHQQRKLARYLVEKLDGQVLITSHSPQIVSEFKADSIVSLFNAGPATEAADDGCSRKFKNAVMELGYRLNTINCESFFSSAVLLVEGMSEVSFYRALAKEKKIDLDRLNMAIVSVEGLSFSQYIKIYEHLNIPWVLRTDFDFFKNKGKKTYRCAGLQRAYSLYTNVYVENKELNELFDKVSNTIKNLPTPEVPDNMLDQIAEIRQSLRKGNIFLSSENLELDLINSEINEDLLEYHEVDNDEDLLISMQERKASEMFNFLSEKSESLKKIKAEVLLAPLLTCKKIIEDKNGGD
ncbi:ATP-dependent endonuclease [Bdellovibrio sp. NC01]|uniref:ATP-dependent nuclease n=1 Tax=Bdellovibrio sp. NC01 TaxID=2220073 RepID=UPI00143CE2F5|nr:AAA family ATPase [Bdellovibrio sp. NC01]